MTKPNCSRWFQIQKRKKKKNSGERSEKSLKRKLFYFYNGANEETIKLVELFDRFKYFVRSIIATVAHIQFGWDLGVSMMYYVCQRRQCGHRFISEIHDGSEISIFRITVIKY